MVDRIEPGEKLTDNDLRNLFFGNYMEPDAEPKYYDEVESYEKLEKVMHYYLKDFNDYSSSPMDLVLFRFAVEHISRVSRVLQMPRGNILMVGMGGSGRRSSAKLAASIAEAKLMTVEITKTYSMNEWREDIRKILMTAGMNLNHTVFLFSDSQVNSFCWSLLVFNCLIVLLVLKHNETKRDGREWNGRKVINLFHTTDSISSFDSVITL